MRIDYPQSKNCSIDELNFMRSFIPRRRKNVIAFLLLISFGYCLLFNMVFALEDMPTDEYAPAYKIGAEDVLNISVWKEPELQREVIVRPDGGISFPFAGDVKASGKTPSQLQVELTIKIQKFIPDAMVTVSVTKLAGLRIYVMGKVNKPGQYVIGRYVDVLQALTLAGGLDPYASEKKIKVLRRQANREVVLPFNYSAVKDGEDLEQNILLQSDDVVVVP